MMFKRWVSQAARIKELERSRDFWIRAKQPDPNGDRHRLQETEYELRVAEAEIADHKEHISRLRDLLWSAEQELKSIKHQGVV